MVSWREISARAEKALVDQIEDIFAEYDAHAVTVYKYRYTVLTFWFILGSKLKVANKNVTNTAFTIFMKLIDVATGVLKAALSWEVNGVGM